MEGVVKMKKPAKVYWVEIDEGARPHYGDFLQGTLYDDSITRQRLYQQKHSAFAKVTKLARQGIAARVKVAELDWKEL